MGSLLLQHRPVTIPFTHFPGAGFRIQVSEQRKTRLQSYRVQRAVIHHLAGRKRIISTEFRRFDEGRVAVFGHFYSDGAHFVAAISSFVDAFIW